MFLGSTASEHILNSQQHIYSPFDLFETSTAVMGKFRKNYFKIPKATIADS